MPDLELGELQLLIRVLSLVLVCFKLRLTLESLEPYVFYRCYNTGIRLSGI